MGTKKSEGFGDTIEKIAEATGIKKVVEAITDDCGCEERKQKLNNLFPYSQLMEAEQKEAWEKVVKPAWDRGTMKAGEQHQMNEILRHCFPRSSQQMVSCGGCVTGNLKKLQKVYDSSCE